MMNLPRYFCNRTGFGPTSDGKDIVLIRIDDPQAAWMMFNDGTQRT
jgi:hypothetical protein